MTHYELTLEYDALEADYEQGIIDDAEYAAALADLRDIERRIA